MRVPEGREPLTLTATMPSLGPFSQASSMSTGGLKRRRGKV